MKFSKKQVKDDHVRNDQVRRMLHDIACWATRNGFDTHDLELVVGLIRIRYVQHQGWRIHDRFGMSYAVGSEAGLSTLYAVYPTDVSIAFSKLCWAAGIPVPDLF